MKRFGPDSTEKIHLDFGDAAGFLPVFSFEGSAAGPGRIPNWFGLVGFIVFWLVAFKFLAVMTAPVDDGESPNNKTGEVASV